MKLNSTFICHSLLPLHQLLAISYDCEYSPYGFKHRSKSTQPLVAKREPEGVLLLTSCHNMHVV
eukprot:235730-Amphidinium_carterae.1